MMKVLAMKRDMTKIDTMVKRVHSFLVTTPHHSFPWRGAKDLRPPLFKGIFSKSIMWVLF
jgi:hypothetical protein